ncbi:hypothetical protein N431DRAFT_473889 [Stipitochalara longipes BDJ]|nr:hypothetical protein N431DRAFT_473889 [Stipitochalara longipes BDJ]
MAMRPVGGRPSLLGLPIEIYDHLLDFLPCLFDVWALSGTCRQLHSRTDPHLYKQVVLNKPKYHKSMNDALASHPERTAHVRDYAIEYTEWAQYHEKSLERPSDYLRDLEYNDADILSQLVNLRRLKIRSPWFDEHTCRTFTMLWSPSTPAFNCLISCEIDFIPTINHPKYLAWGSWLMHIFLNPTLETLIVHRLHSANLEGFDHIKFDLECQKTSTPLKELHLLLININPEFLGRILQAPTALERLEIDREWSSCEDPILGDISLWVDAVTPQCKSLKRLALLPTFKNTARPLILDDFAALNYLSINDAYVFKESEKRQFHPAMDRIQPPNLEVLEFYWRERGDTYEPEDNDFMEKFEAERHLWPHLKHIVTIFDQLIPTSRNQDLRNFNLTYYMDIDHPYEFQDRSGRLEWPKSWYSPDSRECRLNQKDAMKVYRGLPLDE